MTTLPAVVRAAVAGDTRAIAHLVARFDRHLRSIARSYGLEPWDVDDVVQNTWVQFLGHGANLRDAAAISGWLTTTARRHCLRVLQVHVREHLSDDPANDEAGDDEPLDEALVAHERRTALHASIARLTDRQRALITVLLEQPNLSYEEIGDRLGLPIGSIGPTRARALAELRRSRELQAVR